MIKIDLNDLTQDKLDLAMPNLRKCTYRSPCILGALMTESERKTADTPFGEVEYSDNILNLVNTYKTVEMPQGQLDLAFRIQTAFDEGNLDTLSTAITELNPSLVVKHELVPADA